MDPVPEPVFNISEAIFFFFLSGIERLSHTLSGNWKCLCFSGNLAEASGEVTKPSLCVTAQRGCTAAADR